MSIPMNWNEEMNTMSAKLTSAATFTPATINNTPEQSKMLTSNTNSGTSIQNIDCQSSSTMQENNRDLPELNIPEKILFVVDTAKEENCTPFKVGTGESYSPLYMIKRVVETFINAKSTIQRKHEYGLMILESSSVRWISDFTNNVKTILNYLDTIEESINQEKTFNMGLIFKEIWFKIPKDNCVNFLPVFTTRVILIYSRSNCIPKFYECSGPSGSECLVTITSNPYFFLDVLYVHEPPTTENLCEDVYTELISLDICHFCHVYEVGRNAAKLHDNMAKLLAHPLQRPLQVDTCYSINESILTNN
ncbi:BRISC and BRCA1-A complex member 1-like isoform X1 [Polistes fuscatus]|uniref:BRISC and BRCA1-A complex member 1-like isoform X1 n=1 Tax=Polistes fuscatus TaxID=30207 RepID=UPI001CA9106F|nr:BRISC and BRCA1-A complex member 1-like isoform X1 [Polistes fuscatus]